jgi:4-carboxymuconolactone decarboxylase
MSRVPVRSREELSTEGCAVYDEIMATRGKVDEAFQVLLPTAELLRRIAHLGSYIRFESSLPAAVRECIILATARHFWSEFEWTDHELQARKAGVSGDTIQSIKNGEPPTNCSAEEGAVVQFVYETLRGHRITDATFQTVQSAFGIEATTEIAATMGYYCMLSSILNAFDVGR